MRDMMEKYERLRDGVFEMNVEGIWFEWHDRDWVSPHVEAIRNAVHAAAS